MTVDQKTCAWGILRTIKAICYANAGRERLKIAECYRSVSTPTMNIEDYWRRIVDHFYCEPNTYRIALIYIQRLNAYIPIKFENVHRVLLVACVLARKYHEDFGYNNEQYAKIGGIDMKELFLLELDFCKRIEYNLFVKNLA